MSEEKKVIVVTDGQPFTALLKELVEDATNEFNLCENETQLNDAKSRYLGTLSDLNKALWKKSK